jgi:hypothetical protein
LSQGYFINKDGIKSTDLKTTKKRGIAAISSTAGDLSPSGSVIAFLLDPDGDKSPAVLEMAAIPLFLVVLRSVLLIPSLLMKYP